MIDYACKIYMEQRKSIKGKPISAWFVLMFWLLRNKRQVLKYDLNVELITAKTPLKERLVILDKHEKGDIESLISVGVLSEGGITLTVI